MRLLFRLNLGGELGSGHHGPAEGLGHATRCLALAEALRDEAPAAEILFALRGPEAALALFRDRGFACHRVAGEGDCLRQLRPDATILDLNGADHDLVALYRGRGPVINLAARGVAKHYADLTFNNTTADPEPAPADARPGPWHRGPRYALIARRFTALRPAAEAPPPARFSCLVCLGGIDRDGMTDAVLEALVSSPAVDFPVTLVAGTLNPHLAALRAKVARRPEVFTLAVDPPDFPARLAAASLGIFGLGGVTDEALTLGVPSLNLGLTRFHELRGQALEAEGVITYLGRFGQVSAEAIAGALLDLRRDPGRLAAQRRRALALYDGRGSQRVARAILGFLESRAPACGALARRAHASRPGTHPA